MEQNRTVWIIVAVAALLAVIALGVVLRGTSQPTTPDEVLAVPAPTAEATAKPAPATPDAPTPTAVADSEYVTDASGLKYYDLQVGDGAAPTEGSVVFVHYTGWLTDGTMFDSSMKRRKPFSFVLGAGQVIKGWDLGVASMKVGGKRQLVIPGDLAYGPMGRPPKIPANATLIFEVELLDIGEARHAPDAPQKLADSEYTTTDSGLKYHDFEVGTGASPTPGAIVKVDYTGWLTDGTKFDSSLDRAEPIEFPIGQGRVIKGWDEGVMSMKVGGSRQLVIPADIAYGERGRPPVIPPSSTLVFEVKLVDVQQ